MGYCSVVHFSCTGMSKELEQAHHRSPETLVFAEEVDGKKDLCQKKQQWVEGIALLTWVSTSAPNLTSSDTA